MSTIAKFAAAVTGCVVIGALQSKPGKAYLNKNPKLTKYAIATQIALGYAAMDMTLSGLADVIGCRPVEALTDTVLPTE